MTNAWKWIAGAALVLAVIAIFLGISHSDQATSLGASGNYPTVVPNPTWFSNGLQVGQTGTAMANQQFGICNLVSTSSIPANTVKTFDCTVTGIRSGDFVLADPPAGLPSGVYIQGAVASTTVNNDVTFYVNNASSTAYTTLPISGWEYRAAR